MIKFHQFHIPNLKTIKKQFKLTPNEHFKYDENNQILYTNNINCVYEAKGNEYINSVSKKLLKKDTDVFIRDLSVESDILKPYPKELFPYHSQVNKKPFVHGDPGILYPLFKNNIIINLLFAPLRDSKDDGIINTRIYYKYTPTGYGLEAAFIESIKGGRKRNTVKSAKSAKSVKSVKS